MIGPDGIANEFGRRVLIVEDENIVALDLRRRMELLGYTVVGTVGSGEQALELAAQCSPDIVMMDIQLAGSLDGIETAAILVREHSVPVIYLTLSMPDLKLRSI